VGGGGAAVWGINSSSEIFRFDFTAQAFKRVPGVLKSIAVGGPPAGPIGVWGVNAADDIFQFNGSKFVQVSGSLSKIAVFGGSVWGINSAQDIFRLEF
jgi:hypothetical protein